MRIIFMGSAEISCRSLNALCEASRHEVVGIVTQPDRPKGRQLKTTPCPAKLLGEAKRIPMLSPTNVNVAESLSWLRGLKPDLIVVVAYGQMLGQAVLDLPPNGCVNLHASLLPLYRGAAPIQWAIAKGETMTGVTVMYMVRKMDAGDIILQQRVPVSETDTGGSLHDKLSEAGACLLVEAVDQIGSGQAQRVPQSDSESTYAPKLGKDDGRIGWGRIAVDLYNQIRGFNPWPGCFCLLGPMGILKVLRARVEASHGEPGMVLDVTGDGPLIGTADKSLRLLDVQPEGRKVMSGADYLHGHDIKKGDRLP